jgi:hypothetical protein
MLRPGSAAVYRYFPGALDGETLRYLLVGRQKLLEDLLEEIDRASQSGTPRFLLLVGPHGSGKSHLMSLLHRRVRDELSERIIPVTFAEKEYSIFRASDFVLRVLEGIEIDISDVVALKEDSLIRDIAIDKLKEIASIGGKQIVIFVDNIHEIFDQMDTREIRALRSIFQRADILSVVASAPSVFPGVLDHDEPFYNFFRILHLRELRPDEVKDLMKRVARLNGNTAFVENFRDYEPGIEGLLPLLGGNPRLIVQLYETASRVGTGDAGSLFFRMMDEHTPCYREVFRRLPGQRRVIFDTVLSADTPLTPKDIAGRARLNLTTVNAQLRRLEADGYVVSHPMGRRTMYEVRDRLFWLWRAMRRSAGRQRVVAFIEFLEAWHERPADVMEGGALQDPSASYIDGKPNDALTAIETAAGQPDGPDQAARFMQFSLNLAREELRKGNTANGLHLIDLAYTHADRLDPDTVKKTTVGFLKKLIEEKQIPLIKSAVHEIIASGGAEFERFLKPVTDAVEIVEANDTRLYYTKLQREERAVVAGIVLTITGSEELLPGL